MAKESERGDPFPALPRRGIERQFADVSEPEIRKALAVAGIVNDNIEAPRTEIAPVEAEIKVKRGRPPKYPDHPWEAEGITRRTWERREREKKA